MNKKSRRGLKRKNRKSLRKRGGAAAVSSASKASDGQKGYAATLLLRAIYPDDVIPPPKIQNIAKELTDDDVVDIHDASDASKLTMAFAQSILTRHDRTDPKIRDISLKMLKILYPDKDPDKYVRSNQIDKFGQQLSTCPAIDELNHMLIVHSKDPSRKQRPLTASIVRNIIEGYGIRIPDPSPSPFY
jgi:hypothetical protein